MALTIGGLAWFVATTAGAAPDPARGEYVFHMSGCASCHTAEGGAFLAGGRRLMTPFGAFLVPNITPDRATGIGGWSEADLVRAMTEGVSPTGGHYYPSFPYTSYTRMRRSDIADLKAYLDTVPAVRNAVGPHEMGFPFSVRLGNFFWKLLFFSPGEFVPDPAHDDEWNRGAYLVNGPGHCGECHTPRNILGGLDRDRALAGATLPEGDGGKVPSLRGLDWSVEDFVWAFETGLLPDGDALGSSMADVITENTSKLTAGDRRAIAVYLKSLPKPAAD
ncbi:MAG: c-type cytochrome [Alphaproteobacteria bacterium]|nr:c-type cytochrome [Alphaproteobacteria bacterium]